MATVNTHPVILRHNRPGALSEVLLEMYFIHNGQVTHPYEVCSVHIFPDNNNGDSSNWLETTVGHPDYGLVASSVYSQAAAVFWVSGITGGVQWPGEDLFGEDQYAGGNDISEGIYMLGNEPGRYGVVLSHGDPWHWSPSGWTHTEEEFGPEVSGLQDYGTGKYWDIWTVVDANGSNPRTYVHSFELFRDDVITLTEPMMVTTRHHLVQKYVNKNSVVQLQITSDHTVNNANITEEIKNAFTQSVIGDAGIRILKLKEDTSTGLPYVQVLDWNNSTRIDSSDTITFLWDTSNLDTGTYELQVSSNILNQKVFSDKFNLVVR